MSNTRRKRKRNVQKVLENTTILQGYRFLNPYNFVRTLETRNAHLGRLLGRCAPPPHDRMVGLSGRIHCRLTATTPIFVSDSEDVIEENVNGKIHRYYRFFRDPEGKIAIPATGLRGAVRSIFEAATNSCFAHFAGNKRLSYHLPPNLALQLVPARVQRSNGRWELALLPGTTTITLGRRPSGPQYAAWVHVYDSLHKRRTVLRASTTPCAGRKKLLLAGYRHGEEVYALIELVTHPHRKFRFWNVVHLARSAQELPAPTGRQQVVSGYLCINNQNIENKHDERLFFTTEQLPPVALPDDVRQRYEELIADYQERHQDEVRSRRYPHRPHGSKPAFSRFILERTGRGEAKLRDGDLVYAMLEDVNGECTVKFIVPVSVPRVGFDRTIGELLSPEDLKKCTDYDHLCPACRTFGWIWSDESAQDAPDLSKQTAYAGRVRFNHATLVKDAGTFDTTLAILSTPKPTTYRFYLRPRNGKPQDGLPDQEVDYNNPDQILRGRKFYRHHGAQLNWQEYCSVDGAKSDQNRTVLGVQQAGSEFIFTVDFTNLAPVELGALLWSLRLEGWHHRIGYAKPLGSGSAQIDIQEMEILDPEARYASLSAGSGWIKADDQQINWWINLFKKEMGSRYGAAFDQLANIRDLKALLGEEPALPVHYPRPTPQPQAEGRQYEWFVGNKRDGKNSGPRLGLQLATDDHQGLPLIG